MHIFEVLNNRVIKFNEEASKLKELFQEKEQFFTFYSSTFSFFAVINHCFRDLQISGNYISYTEFLNENDFDECDNVEDFILLCEKILSLLYQSASFLKGKPETHYNVVSNKIRHFTKVINYDLETLGYKKEVLDNQKFGKLIAIYPSEVSIIKAIEIEPNLSESIINYSRPSNKGNLEEKEKYLHFIIKHVEHIAQDKSFKYKKIAEQAETIFNMFNLRHDNIQGKMKNGLLPEMSDEELESVFDMGYRLSLELIILNEFTNIDTEVDKLREKMKEKKL